MTLVCCMINTDHQRKQTTVSLSTDGQIGRGYCDVIPRSYVKIVDNEKACEHFRLGKKYKVEITEGE